MASGITVGWGSQWEQLANAINSYYGGGISSSQYQTVVNYLNSGEYTMEQMESILRNIPEFDRTYNQSGQLIKVSYRTNISPAVNTAGDIASQINSNVAEATSGKSSVLVKDVQNISVDAQTGKATISNNVTKYTNGVAGQAKALAGSALSAICAASVGITLGKTIDSLLYNANPDFWDSHGMSTLNPATWASITSDGEGGVADSLFNFIYQIDPATGNPQPYMDENAFAYMAAYMTSQGVFTGEHYEIDDTSLLYNEDIRQPINSSPTITSYTESVPSDITLWYGVGDDVVHGVVTYPTEGVNNGKLLLFSSRSPFDVYTNNNGTVTKQGSGIQKITKDGKIIYQYGRVMYLFDWQGDPKYECGYSYAEIQQISYSLGTDIGNIVVYGDQTQGVNGINDQSGATQFNTSGILDPSDISLVLAALQTQFPELWNNRIEYSTDGQTKQTYIPTGFPTGGTGLQPTTDGATQGTTAPQIDTDGSNSTDELIKTLIEMITSDSPTMSDDTDTPVPPSDPNPPGTGTGDTPVVVPPTGSASALWKIYNPSQNELDTFGAWLWSSNFVDQLLKLFSDPMQAIITLHKVFVTPSTNGSGAIKVGYLSSNATANYVDSQYVDVDCGSVNLTEYFGNVFDYDPYTKLSLFLPFIGFVDLSVSDCMRGEIGVQYHVDILTGQCLAEVSVTRDLHENVLYTYVGNCAVQYPVSSGSYIGILGGLLGVAGVVASGGSLAPVAIGAMAAVGGIHTDVKHSGNIGGAAGAMGIKKPYIVIERPQTALPRYYDMIEGEPQNEYTTLSDCIDGYVKVKKAIYNIPAERDEIDILKSLLETGVYI